MSYNIWGVCYSIEIREVWKISIKWDSRNLRTVSTHLRTEEAEELQQICALQHITPYSMMREYLRDYIKQHRNALRR